MASSGRRNRYELAQALELVMEDGSDLDDGEAEDSDDNNLDSGEEFFPADEEFGSDDSDNDSGGGENATLGAANLFSAATDVDSDSSDMSVGEQAEAPPLALYDDESDEDWMSEWTRSLSNFPLNTPFTGTPGLQLPDDFEATPTPLDFYRLFITHDLVKSFKVETNRYAATQCTKVRAQGNLSPRSIFLTWKPVTMDEMTKFLSILIHIGLVKKPQLDDYWSTHPVLSTTYASRLLKRSRFKAILAFFHLNDNAHFIPRG